MAATLNVQCLNASIYFEFYYNDDLFYRKKYDSLETDIPLHSLCEYLTSDLFKQINYKRFTGFKFHSGHLFRFSYIIQSSSFFEDIDQPDAYCYRFPLSIVLSPERFAWNLHLNLVFTLEKIINSTCLAEYCSEHRESLQRLSRNIFWRHFPNDIAELAASLKERFERDRKELQTEHFLKEGPAFAYDHLASRLENYRHDWKEFLVVFEALSKGCISFCRDLRRGGRVYFDKEIFAQHLPQMSISKCYFHYLLGDFDELSEAQLNLCVSVSAGVLFNQYNALLNENEELVDFLTDASNTIGSEKDKVLEEYYDLQDHLVK